MKISIVGAGNGGCFTALHFVCYSRGIEIEIVHNPNISPEPVGQATLVDPPRLLFDTLGFDWFNNRVHATPKTGIVYEGWGKVNEKVSNPFPANHIGMHFCPSEVQSSILNSGLFRVIEDDVDPKDVDADYVFDCRGKPEDLSDYDELKNPINAVILGKPNWDVTCLWTRAVATPDGWTFVIPTLKDSPAYKGCVGYLYNSDITSKEDAEKNFLEMFDVEISGYLNFNNYVAKDFVVDDRIFLNGNRLFFLEPLEASALQTHLEWARHVFDIVLNKSISMEEGKINMRNYIEKVQNFILWHYHFGSKYDTPFWEYARTLTFKDSQFNMFLEDNLEGWYAYWDSSLFKRWHEGMTLSLGKK